MIFGNNRTELRRFFYDSWQKYGKQLPTTDLENQIIELISEHPEYQSIFADKKSLEIEFFPELNESNPFLHLSLHLTIREQLSTDNPKGIREVVQSILQKFKNPHEVEHKMMRCLSDTISESIDQKNPDMADYLACLKRLR